MGIAIRINNEPEEEKANTLENDGSRLFPEMDEGTQISVVESAKSNREEKKKKSAFKKYRKNDFNPNKDSSYYSKTVWMIRTLKVLKS